jgi:hypothetical protein
MTWRALILLGAVLTAESFRAVANRIYVPEFTTPFLVGDKVIFGAPEFPGHSTHRLICIEKGDGKKLWEKTEETAKMRAWFVMNGQLILTIGNDIQNCDPETGKCRLLYRTGYDKDVYIREQEGDLLLVEGPRNNVDYLSLVDRKSWRKIWEVSRISGVVARGKDTLLCMQGDRHSEPGGGYSLRNQRSVALSVSDGTISWSHPGPQFVEAAAVSNYFLVYANGSIQCLNQSDGTLVRRSNWKQESVVPAQMLARDQKLLVKILQFDAVSIKPKNVLFTLSVPDLKQGELSEDEWKKAWGEKFEVKDDVSLFYSSISSDWKTNSVCREVIKTGKVTELYQEPVPPAYSRTR